MISKFARRAVVTVLALAGFANVAGQPIAQRTDIGTTMSGGLTGAGSSAAFRQPSFVNPSAFNLPQGAILPTDNSIDENEYIIGAGDVFFITAVESQSIRYTAAVDQSGRAFVQNVGVIDIGKVTYAEAKKTIGRQISSMMRNPTEIYVTLIQIKEAAVSVTGQISAPGTYVFPGITRLLDAIVAANGGVGLNVSSADMRQIQLTRGDSVMRYDLLAYLYKDDRSQNPYIYPGDRVRINPVTDQVVIGGAIRTPPPGLYPIKKDETLKEFLSLFTIDNAADLDNIIIYKSVDNAKITVTQSEMDIILNDRDAITIPLKKNQPGIHTASIAGEVASPGSYPIIENTTTAKQLIDMAGGMKSTGHVDQVVIIRPSRNLPDPFTQGAPSVNVVRPERGSSISMAATSLDYTVIRLILYNADKVILEPGDRIYVPKRDRFVYISGAVRNPGAYPFLMGRSSDYYIKQAGGYSKNADKSNVQVYLKYGDIVQGIEPQCVEAGSVIVVPSSVQHKFLSQVVLPIVSALATTISIGLAIYSHSRR